jgi:uncharacterized protein YukE
MTFARIPGDPGAIDHAASSLSSLSHGVEDSASQITAVASSVMGPWQGQAAGQFEALSGRIATSHRDAGDLLSRVAAALSTFAGKLTDAQAKQHRAETMANTAVGDAASAMANLAVTYGVSEIDIIAGVVPQHDAQDIAGAQRSIDNALTAQTAAARHLQQQAEEEYHAACAELRRALGDGLSAAHTVENGVLALGNALGMPSTAWTGVSTILFLKALYNWGTIGEKIPTAIADAFSDSIGPLALAADRGELTWEEVGAAYENFAKNAKLAANLFDHGAEADVAAGGIDLGRVGGVGLGALSLVGDAATIISPPDSGAWGWTDRGMAAANAAGTTVGMLGAVGVIDASTGWIPVAGQVVVIGTGLYLAGDFLYHDVAPFRDAINDTGQFIANTAVGGYHLTETAVSDGLHAAGDVANTAGDVVSSGVHDVESVGSGAVHTARSVVDSVGSFLGL